MAVVKLSETLQVRAASTWPVIDAHTVICFIQVVVCERGSVCVWHTETQSGAGTGLWHRLPGFRAEGGVGSHERLHRGDGACGRAGPLRGRGGRAVGHLPLQLVHALLQLGALGQQLLVALVDRLLKSSEPEVRSARSANYFFPGNTRPAPSHT